MSAMMDSLLKTTVELYRIKALLKCNSHSSLTSQQVCRNIHTDTQILYFAVTEKKD